MRDILLIKCLLVLLLLSSMVAKATTITHNIANGSLIIEGNDTNDYILTGTTTTNTVTVRTGYQGAITLSNLSITSSTSQGYGRSGYSCITIEGSYNQSNLNPVTNVRIILDGTNNLTYTNINYCGIQVNQGAQIRISAIDSTNNASGILKATCTRTDGGAAIGAPNFVSSNPGTSEGNMGQGTSVITGALCTRSSLGTTAGGNIIISSGIINADTRNAHGAAIGGGFRSYYNGIIIIYGGEVTADGGTHAAGIGAGCPNGYGVESYCFPENSAVIALPPSQIKATTLQPGASALGATKSVTYINDPTKSFITVRTKDYIPNANIYLDLTQTEGLVNMFNKLDLGWYDLAKIFLGKTDADGLYQFHAELQQPTTFFTNAFSILGRPYGPEERIITGDSNNYPTVELLPLDIDISLEAIPSIPLQVGYTSPQASINAPRVKITYMDKLTMENVMFSITGGSSSDFSGLEFYGPDGRSHISAPTSLTTGDIFYVAIPLKTGKTIDSYSDVLRFSGSWNGQSTGYIRQVVEQDVIEQSSICTPNTLIYKEDFGGNSIFSPTVSRSGLSTDLAPDLKNNSWTYFLLPVTIATAYLHHQNIINPFTLQYGNYSLVKKGKSRSGIWYEPYDHTYPGTSWLGYMMEVNGSSEPATYYRFTMNDLCPGTQLQFSAWGMSLMGSTISIYEDTKLQLVIKTNRGIEVGKQDVTLKNGKGYWEQFELVCEVPPGETSLVFEIINNNFSEISKYYGNDFALDDIEVRMCTPKVELKGSSGVCQRDDLRIEYINNNDFSNPAYKWFKSSSGNINGTWIEVDGANESTLLIENTELADAGYYRLEITDGSGSCPAKSNPMRISVRDCDECAECVSSFAPVPGEKYVLSAWVKETGHSAEFEGANLTGDELMITSYENSIISLSFENSDEVIGAMAEGPIIDGWQRIYTEFTVPAEAVKMFLDLGNTGGVGESYFDDIRVFPLNGNMKSYVYDPVTMRLTAELDNENYATFYEYDEEGALVRIKKETERGIMTIREARQAKPKKR